MREEFHSLNESHGNSPTEGVPNPADWELRGELDRDPDTKPLSEQEDPPFDA